MIVAREPHCQRACQGTRSSELTRLSRGRGRTQAPGDSTGRISIRFYPLAVLPIYLIPTRGRSQPALVTHSKQQPQAIDKWQGPTPSPTLANA